MILEPFSGLVDESDETVLACQIFLLKKKTTDCLFRF
jgi:hypothetical protein